MVAQPKSAHTNTHKPADPSKSERISALAAECRQASVDLYLACVARGAERPSGHPDTWPRALDYSQRSAKLARDFRHFPEVRRAASRHAKLLSELFTWQAFLCELGLRRTEKARSYTGLEREDAKQEATFGILRAIELWDPHRGTAFATYACHWVEEKMRRFANNNLPVSIPTLALGKNTPSGEDGRRARGRRYVELDKVYPNEEGVADRTMLDRVLSSSEGPVLNQELRSDLEGDVDQMRARKRLYAVIETLPEKQMDVLVGLCFRGESFAEIAERNGVSRQQIHNRWLGASKALRCRLRANEPDLADSL